MQLTLERWKDLFVSSIQSTPEEQHHWPILTDRYCHCSLWIKRAKQEKLFDEKELELLSQVHDEMHVIANHLHNEYQNGNLSEARAGLVGLQKVYIQIGEVLEQHVIS